MFDLNQVKGFSSASWLVTVGDRRASIGEPMKVIEAGRFGSFVLGHQGGGGQHRRSGLADADDVGARADLRAAWSRTWSM